jgi:hypothetical protein
MVSLSQLYELFGRDVGGVFLIRKESSLIRAFMHRNILAYIDSEVFFRSGTKVPSLVFMPVVMRQELLRLLRL